MSEQIREALQRLNASDHLAEALPLAEEVERTCAEQSFSVKDSGYVTSLLAGDAQSLVSFLKKHVATDQLKDAKAKGLHILTGWFERVPASQLLHHALAIKDVSCQLLFRDKTAKVRLQALVLLSKVLEACKGASVCTQLDVPGLVERMFMLLSQPSKLTPTVKEEILCVLGVIAECHQVATEPYRDKLLALYLAELQRVCSVKEKNVVAGCLQGLSGFLFHFGTCFEDDPDNCFKLFKCVKRSLTPSDRPGRYDIPRAALILLSKHAALFGQLLLDDHRTLYQQLGHWSRHGNRELQALGTAALESFLREVASALVEHADRQDYLDIFQFFIQDFQRTLKMETSNRGLAAALKGYGLFALPCKRYLKEADVLYMLNDVLLRSEHVFQSISSHAVLEDSLPLLSSFQEATASILRCTGQVPASQLALLEKLTVLQIENFPLVAQNLQMRYCRSLLFVLLAVYPISRSSLSRIVYQGLVRTCSHPIAAQVEASREDDGISQSRTITYRRYNFLWAYLLNAVAVQELNQMQISLEARHMLVRDVYDGLLSSALSVVSKLNLSVRQQASSDDGDARVDVSDPTCGIEAQCPKDFNIFINLVDFFRDTFTKKHLELFAKWAFVVLKQMVEYSARHPLVSGFYKVVAASVGICERSSYFEQPSGEAVACLRLVSGLLRDVLGRLQQLKDDLLASCLELVLGTPLALVREHARALVPAVGMALQQGLSYLPLAKASLDALRLWEKQLPADVADDMFRQVLPGLCPYLALGVRAGITEPAESTKRARSQGRHKVSLKLLYQKKRDQIKVPETESLRLDVLSFLGGLQGHRRALLLADLERDTLRAALAWDPETKEHLVFALPFPDTKVEIALDAFLPRVVELARFAGDRQTKVAGCELLHAMVLYAVGTGVQTSAERRAKFPMVHLFKHLFPELLHLACDVDQVTQRLFRPLVLQLMHWFSSGSTRGSTESVAIVECLWDTVTQPQETVLKDFAARCLREFVQWGIKQSTPKELEKGPTNVKSVLRRLCSYCRHPSALKRLGAALVFNNLYVLLREEESLVDVFILDILAHFVDSLKLAHSDERTIGTRELSGCALDNVLRIVSTKSELLNRPNVKRKWPSDTGGEPPVLSTAVRWLLLQTSRPQADCRHKCMELVHALIPKLPGAPSHQSYMSSLLHGSSPGFFVESFEGNLAAPERHWATLSAVCKFCDQLLGLLECYTWILEQRLLEPKHIFEVPKKPSGLFGMVDHFLEHLAVCESPQELLRDAESEPLTSSKLSAFNLAKCSVTVRLFNFLATWMETSHGSMASVANPFWRSRPFWRCTVVCVLSPSDAGFDLTDLEVANQLPNEMLRFLKCVSKTFPKLLAENFVGAHTDFVDHLPECGLDKVLAMPLTNLDPLRNDLLKWIGLASGYRLLAELRIIRVPDSLAARALVRSLAELLGSRGADLTPLGKELCLRVLELAAALGAQARDVLEALLPSRAWEVLGAQLCRHFAERASDYVPAALALAEGAPKMLTTVMSHMLQDKELTSRRGSELSLEVMRCWPSMERFWSEGTPQDVVNGALHMLEKLVLLTPEVGSPKGPHFERLFEVFLKLLERSGATLADKVLVLDLLPVFASDVRPDTGLKLRDALEEMVAQHFPLDSSTLLPGAPEYLCYVGAMRKMVAGLERSGSPVLLELLIRVLYRERGSHFLEAEVLLALQRTVTRCGEAKQQQLIEAAYKCGATNQGLLISARLSVASKLLPLLLKSCSKAALRHFFVDNVTAMVDAVAAKIRHGSESELTSKIVALSCLEVLYSCCTKDDVTGKQSSVNAAFCRSRGIINVVGNELTKEITKHANSAKKEVVCGDVEFADLWRQLRCAAYRLVVAVVSCTQTESQFYDVFVFQERPEKGEFLWNNLVDEKALYTFPLEREVLSQKSRHVVGVTEAQVPSPSFSGRMSGSLRGSSLAQEASQYSLSASGLAFWEVETVDSDSSKGTQAPAKEPVSRLKVMDLEDDALNSHECMASVCSVLCRMADLGIIPKTADEEVDIGPAPKWLTFLTSAIVGNHTTRNTLCFICRIVVNSAEVLRVYSRHLVPALLTVLAEDKLGTELDAFVIDVAVTVLMWASDWSLEDRKTVGNDRDLQGFSELLAQRCGHERREVLRNNLELLRAWVETWRERLRFPADVVLQQLQQCSLDSKDHHAVLLFGIFVSNNLVKFGESHASTARILEVLPRLLASRYRGAYTSVADVVGLTLRKMSEAGIATEDSAFEGSVASRLDGLLATHRDQFVLCVRNVCRFYQPLALRFLDKLMLLLPRALADFKVAVLEVLSLCCHQMEQPVGRLQGLGFLELLAHGDEKMQTVLLEICTKLVGAATEEDWGAILPVVCQLQGHTSGACRKLVNDVCMRLYAKYRSKTSAAGLAKQSKHILLLGLGDPEDSLRLSVANFWSQETQLPLKARERLVALLAGMYSPEIEDHFLSSVTFLLLELASRSPDYGRKLFPRPLSDCRFVDYAVTGSWRQRHAAMTPLFAETLSWSQSQSSTTTSQSTRTSATTDPGPMLRATQVELQFTPTQRGTSGAAPTTAGSFNWLTQSTLESNLPGAERRRSLSILSFVPAQEEVLLGASQTSQKSKELGFLRRRFLRDEDKVRLQHIKREVRRKELRGEQERERRARREAEVTLYRSYRLGDLPDIEIPHSALVAPLQALAQHDQQVAQVLLTSIVKTVVKDGADLPELCRELEAALSSILATSDRCFPPLVAFVQETSFSCAGGLKLPVDAVAKASVASGHQSLGILVLEEVQRVRASSEPRPPSPKRTRKEAAQACGPWLQMAQLYKSLGDYDTVRATLSCSEDVDAKAKEALQKEAQGDYSGARDAYRNLVSSGPIWDDAVLQCCRLLGEWTELQREVDSRLARCAGNKWDHLWDGGYSEEHYLPLYVKSRVKTALERGSGEDQFLDSIRQWLEDPARKRPLETECVEELVLLFLLQKDMGKADYYVRCLAEQFLEEWSGLSVLTPALLEGKLESLMVLSDLAEYVKHHSPCGTEDDVDRLLSKWRSRMPSNADSVLLWNDVISNRCFLVQSLGQNGASEKARLLNAFAGAMLQRENIPTALRCVLEIEKMRTEGQLEGSLEWSYAETYCSALCRAAEQAPLDKQLASHLRMLQKLEATRSEGLDDAASTVRYCLLKAQAISGLAKDLDAGAVLNKGQVAELQLASASGDPRKMSLELREQALQLHLSAAHCEATPVSVRAEAQLRLARFCNTALQQEEGTLFPDDRRASLPLSLIRSVLTAMRLGSDAAIDMFPRLLQVLQSHPLCGESFAEECAKVPCWMFLGWIGQTLPLLDGAVGPHLFGLVDSIATHYPNALVYAFRVSNEAYSLNIPETKDFILRLKQKMDKLPLVSEFIEALELLQFPDVAFKDWCESMREALNDRKSVDVRKLYADGLRQLFGGESRDLASSSGGGSVHRHFSDVVKKKVTDAFGIEGSKLVKMDAKKFGSECQGILKSYKSLEPTALKDLSPWLSRFNALDRDNKIEIPGQYTGRSKPMPEYHVNIFGFEESVLVLKSKQRPCRITIRGDDEKEHRFLVKTGEDLRQDDRIERLFGAMNALFTADPSCRAKHLQLVTYGVVPLTTRVGLIEWLDGTVVLKDFQRRGLVEGSQGNLARCSRSFGLWSTEDYAKAYKEPSQAVSRFGRCVQQASRESLSKALLGLSSCPEAFFALRSRFVLSHATLCVAHWVLGVGDRHLGNFLVSTNTGLEIGIDFGYAFGLAAQFLPIPELMPFRLSPQYLGLLEPLGKEGPLASAMQDALRALRAGAESILDVLDVFVQEPTVDWMRLAKRQQAGSSPQATKRQQGTREVSLDWFPRQKVSIVRQKLEGGHPSYILRDELKLRKTNQPDFASLELVCLGAPGVESRMRRRFARGDKLSPRDQVNCLLEQATDPAILGLTWTGWEPWL